MFVQAGRGLEAAHAAGLIHRDFKPENVLVDQQGRARVMDFGLARAADSSDFQPAPIPVGSGSSVLTSRLTVPGAVMGTPLYMAPEQHVGATVDARSDQFSFSVALYEALYAQRPFAGDDLKSLTVSVVQGQIRDPPRGRKVPTWLRRAILRGLSAEPEQRYPGMSVMLADLTRDPAVARRRWLLAGTAAASLAVGAWSVASAGHDHCSGADEQLAGVWDGARADEVAAALRATGRPYAESTWSKVQAHLDAHTRAWIDLHVATCEAAARGEISDDLLDLGMTCLERRRSELAALVDRLARADGEVLDRAVAAARGLTPVSVCTDREALLARVRPPEDPTQRAEVDRLRGELDRARAAQEAGKYAEGLAIARAAAVAADAVGHRPLVADARLRVGELHSRAAEFADAEAALRAAVWAAEAGRHDEAAAATWTELVRLHAKQGKLPEAERAAERAGAAVARLGADILAEARLEHELGSLAFHAEKAPEAVERYERALALRERALGADHPETLNTLGNLGNAFLKADRVDEAVAAMERALAAREQILGADHPEAAITLNNLGVVYRTIDRPDNAVAAYQRARLIWRTAFGPDNPNIINADLNLANIHVDRRQFDLAWPLLEEALAIAERNLPEDNPVRMAATANFALYFVHTGQSVRAERLLRDHLALRERLYGPDSPRLAELLGNLGSLAAGREDEDTAKQYLERAVAIVERTAGPEHSELLDHLVNLLAIAVRRGQLDVADAHLRRIQTIAARLGEQHRRARPVTLAEGLVELAHGRPEKALPLLERAARDEEHLDRHTNADLDFALARALALTGGDRIRARTLAQRARATWAASNASRLTASVDTWLARHR